MDWSKQIPFPPLTPWLLIAKEQDFEGLYKSWMQSGGLPEFDAIHESLPKTVKARVHWNTRNMPPNEFPIKKDYRVYEIIPQSQSTPQIIYRDDDKQTVEMKEKATPWYEKKDERQCCVCERSLDLCRILSSCTFDETVRICPTCREYRVCLGMNIPRSKFLTQMNDEMWNRLVKYARLEEESMHKLRYC